MADTAPNPQPVQTPPAGPNQAGEMAKKAQQMFMALPKFEQLAFVGGLVYLIGSFLPVYATKSYEYYGIKSPSVSVNLWNLEFLYVLLAVIIMIVGLVLPFLEKWMPAVKLPLPKPMLYLVAGVIGAIVPIFRWITITGNNNLNMGIGFFALIAGGALIAVGGFQSGGAKMLQEQMQKMRQAPPAGPTPPAATPKA